MSWGRIAAVVLAGLGLSAGCGGGRAPPPGGCFSGMDCKAAEACVRGLCVPLKSDDCTMDVDCGDARWCDEGTCRDREIGNGTDATLGAAPDGGSSTDDGAISSSPDSTTTADDAAQTAAQDAGSGNIDATAPPTCANDLACGAPAAICESRACVPGCGQAGGMVCAGGSVCNNTTGRCQVIMTACAMDSQCAPPMSVCESTQCVNGCGQAGGIQCTGATACNASTGRCDPVAPPPCMNDSACGAPASICVSGSCTAGCATSGCTGAQVCDMGTGRCGAPPPGCPLDTYEPNDVETSATSGLVSGTTYPSLAACDTDDDYYSYTLALGDSLRAEVLFSNAEGDIDLEILDPTGAIATDSTGVGDNEDASYTADIAGAYLVHVVLYRDQGSSPGNSYSLRLTHTPAPPPPMCAADALEENDTQATARAITVPFNRNNLTSCTMDDDFYAITVQPGDEITATASFSTSEGDIDVSLLDDNGTVLDSSTGVSGTETVVWATVVPYTAILRVYLYGDSGSTPGDSYNLSVTTRATCPDDAFEDNDTQSAQKPIIAGFRNGLSSCVGDDDYYRVTLAANQQITVNLGFSHAEGDVDLYILDSGGTIMASSVSVTDDESATFTPTSAGDYTIRVHLYGDLGARPGNFYTMDAIY